MNDPRATYAARLEERRQERTKWALLDRRASTLRGVTFVVGFALLVSILAWKTPDADWFWLPLLAFIGIVMFHERVARRLAKADVAIGFWERGMARLDDDWAGKGRSGIEHAHAEHLYSDDLDLFGEGSLFERLSLATTRAGEHALARWLTRSVGRDEVIARQEAVAEMRERHDLREDLAGLGAELRRQAEPEALATWASRPPVDFRPVERLAAGALAALSVAALIAWQAALAPLAPLLLALILARGLAKVLESRVGDVVRPVDALRGDLRLVSRVLERLEAEHFDCHRLADWQRRLGIEGAPPSARLRTLAQHVERLDSMRNLFFWPFGVLLLWREQIAMAIEAWRQENGAALVEWLEAVGEIEAAASIGAYAFENPDHVVPTLLEGGPCFRAEALGHPLLAASVCVRNDIHLDADLRLLLVSGSNMSGKSTMLRAIGTNAVLAYAGAPVRAASLELSMLRVASAMRVSDDLRAGVSRFYAEIRRLQAIFEASKSEPKLLFLLDEILSGTNSHDRRIGAAAVIRGLVDGGGIGLVTTHDLALAKIVDDLGSVAANVHLQDSLDDAGQMTFDYRLRPGVVEHSNALALMRNLGLSV